LGLAFFLLAAAPAFAAEKCQQALTDTVNQAKAAKIGEAAANQVADLVKQATDLCKGDEDQQKEGLELLRLARLMIGET